MKNNNKLALLASWLVCGRYLCLIFLLSAIQALAASPEQDRLGDVYIIYINPNVETYDAIPRNRLVYNNPCIVSLPPVTVIDRIVKLVNEAHYGPYKNSKTRIKIEWIHGGAMYFDSEGGVFIENDGISKKIGEPKFNEFKEFFEPINRKAGECSGRWPSK